MNDRLQIFSQGNIPAARAGSIRFGRCVPLLALTASCFFQDANAQTRDEICDKVEDFALQVLEMKRAGISEIQLRRAVNVSDNELLDNLVTFAFSDDRVNDEVMLSTARVKCQITFLLAGDMNAFQATNADAEKKEIDPNLPRNEWIAACTKIDWIDQNKKLRGEGTLLKEWDVNLESAVKLADYFWERRESINKFEYSVDEIIKDKRDGTLNEFQGDIAGPAMFCTVDRMTLEKQSQ